MRYLNLATWLAAFRFLPWSYVFVCARLETHRLTPLSSDPLSGEAKAEPAWHGYTPSALESPGVFGGSPFTPFHVPNGSVAMFPPFAVTLAASRDALVGLYPHSAWTGWRSDTPGSWIEVKWFGTGAEWFGSRGAGGAQVEVALDGGPPGAPIDLSQGSGTEQLIYRVAYLEDWSHRLVIRHAGAQGQWLDAMAFVITPSPRSWLSSSWLGWQRKGIVRERRAEAGGWRLVQKGETGVAAMQLAIVDDQHAIIIDKVEHNPLSINGHPAWAALYNLDTHQVTPLDLTSNSFCAGGTFLGNGTFANVGGNPVVRDKTGAADFGDLNGLEAIRLFDSGCLASDPATSCRLKEWPEAVRMAQARWYASVVRLEDGSAMIVGGSRRGGWINNATVNEPTVEFFPPKTLPHSAFPGAPITSSFLMRTLNANLFPLVISLPTPGLVFMAANNEACLYDWRDGTELPLPRIPNGVRVTYPMSGTAVLLPLTPDNKYRPEVLICGGSTIDDTRPSYEIDIYIPASRQCTRIVLDEQGIRKGWEVEELPEARIMPDLVMMPDGKLLIINGAASGMAGYGNVKNQIGQSNAANPVLQPVLYDPAAPHGSRFSSSGIPASTIPRLYHSVATLTPGGEIMVAGSNPNLDRTSREYGTEYRVEWWSPPYVHAKRPIILGLPPRIDYGKKFTVNVQDLGNGEVGVSLVDLGFVTHGVHMNSRLVGLVAERGPDSGKVLVDAPPNASVYPPGYAWLYILLDGVPSAGKRVMVGSGASPPVDPGAVRVVQLMHKMKGYKGAGKNRPPNGGTGGWPGARIGSREGLPG